MSDPILSRVGNAIQDGFFILAQDAARTPVTTKVQGDFTLALSKNGVVGASTAGITIVHLGAGLYWVTIASSAFPAATGTYVLTMYLTAQTQYRWTWTFWVTNDGTAAAPVGPVLFTPAISDGRVTDGTNPLAGATVILRDSLGALYYTATTDVNGLWTPVNFPAAVATYSGYVIRSGYQQASFTITTTLIAATGPGADVALTAAAAASGLTANELWAQARRAARGQTGNQADTEIKQIVTSALELIARSNTWSWYAQRSLFTVNAAYSTGTILLTQGDATVTLTGGTFPSWTADGTLIINGQRLQVLSFTDSTHLELEADWAEATITASGYVLMQDRILLPDDLYSFGRILLGSRWPYGVFPLSEMKFDELINANTTGQDKMMGFCIIKQWVQVFPYPTVSMLVPYTYGRRPATLVSGLDIADWDPAHVDLIHRAIDYQTAVTYGSYAGGTKDEAWTAYQRSLEMSRTNTRETKVEEPITDDLLPLRRPLRQYRWAT